MANPNWRACLLPLMSGVLCWPLSLSCRPAQHCDAGCSCCTRWPRHRAGGRQLECCLPQPHGRSSLLPTGECSLWHAFCLVHIMAVRARGSNSHESVAGGVLKLYMSPAVDMSQCIASCSLTPACSPASERPAQSGFQKLLMPAVQCLVHCCPSAQPAQCCSPALQCVGDCLTLVRFGWCNVHPGAAGSGQDKLAQ